MSPNGRCCSRSRFVEQGEKCIEGSGDGEVHDMFNRACVLERRAHQSSGSEERFEDGRNMALNRK